MKTPTLLPILFTALLALTATAGPITYTYDAAGRLVLVNYGGTTNLYKIYDDAGNLLERSAPGPVMHRTTAGAQTTFAWTELATGFQLVSTPRVRPPVIWTPVAVTPTPSGGFFIATVNRPPGTLFFAIRKP